MPEKQRVTGDDLSDDIWRIVAAHFPGNSISRYISINRTFLYVYLDHKYGEVRWTKLDDKFVSNLKRLQVPLIAKHVRRLYIRAWFIDYLVKRSMLFGKRTKPLRSAFSLEGGKGFAIGLIKSFRKDTTDGDGQADTEAFQGYSKVNRRIFQDRSVDKLSSKQILSLMAMTIQGMTNAVVLDFEWRDLPLNKESSVFLTATRRAFDQSLRKLALQAPISRFQELLAITNFQHLDELAFYFEYATESSTTFSSGTKEKVQAGRGYQTQSSEVTERRSELESLLNTILPFIQHRRAALRSLQISSSSSLDLSSFFYALPHMPVLRRLDLDIHFDESHLSDPSSVLALLQAHATNLFHVKVCVATPTTNFIPPSYDNIKDLVNARKQDVWERFNPKLLADNNSLRSLESLEIPFISLEKTIPLIRRSEDTLTSLKLTNHFLNLDEISAIVSVFNSRSLEIQRLHLEVVFLDVKLLKLLASRLPNLSCLELVYKSSAGAAVELIPNDDLSYTPFQDWKLLDIGIYERRYQPTSPETLGMFNVGTVLENSYMGRISKAVPGIVAWKGAKQPKAVTKL